MPTRILVPLLFIASFTACYEWRLEPLSPEAALAASGSRAVRLTLLDNRRIELANPEVARDTVRGLRLADWDFGSRVPAAVALSQVRLVETRHVSSGRTTGLVIGVGLPLGLAVAVLIAASNLCPLGNC